MILLVTIETLRIALMNQIELTASLSCVAQGLSPFATLSAEQQKKILEQSTHHDAVLALKGQSIPSKEEMLKNLAMFLNSENMPYCVSCGWNFPVHDSGCKLFPLLKGIQKLL